VAYGFGAYGMRHSYLANKFYFICVIEFYISMAYFLYAPQKCVESVAHFFICSIEHQKKLKIIKNEIIYKNQNI
jgi:hypothetical protein